MDTGMSLCAGASSCVDEIGMISASHIETYAQDEVVSIRNVFDAHWLEVVSQVIDQGRAKPDPAPPKHGDGRLTIRFADGASTYRRRGPWTRDMTEYLERAHGLTEGGPYTCGLVPNLLNGGTS